MEHGDVRHYTQTYIIVINKFEVFFFFFLEKNKKKITQNYETNIDLE